MENYPGTLKDHQHIKKNPWHGYNSVLKGKMDSFIIAAHEQATGMNYRQRIS